MPVFEGKMKLFKKSDIKQLDQVCFNAPDFAFGLTYLFQNEGYFGNTSLYKKYQIQINPLRNEIVSSFTLERSGEGGTSLELSPISIGVTKKRQRKSVHTITLTFSPKAK
ncbi:hypothetical protein B4Q04_09390 [Zobellia sp. OII3]|uniref:trypco2 family protein n=1 Tax=Zobellia sp. OII3 TaxID=2034520 RepID=UPI000B52EB61|nr:trypco2 family protein [Zobellia sp. OII3]OWW25798.1 hypothetical protein B4Q04_09390 [Zobellia sp. OII3]